MGTLGFYTNPDFPADSAAAVAAAIQAAQDAQAAAEAAQAAAALAGGFGWEILATSSTSTSVATGGGVFTNTTVNAQTVILPSSPSLGDRVAISDGGSYWNTNNCTVSRNGNKIMGLSEDLTLDVQHQTIILTYSNSALGWRIT